MKTKKTKPNTAAESPKDYIDQFDFFWGKVINFCKDDKGNLTGLVEVEAVDGRQLQLEQQLFTPRIFAKTVKAYSTITPELNVEDRLLFCLRSPYQKDELGADAEHVIFGWATVINSKVTHVDKSGADVLLRGGVRARILAADWSYRSGWSKGPKQGDDIGADGFCRVTQIDAYRKVVYLTKAKHMLRLADVQRRFQDETVVETVEPGMKDGKKVVHHTPL